MVSDSQKHKIIKEFFIPDELKDDIAYCQRSLRDCVKVHQHFAQQCKRLSATQVRFHNITHTVKRHLFFNATYSYDCPSMQQAQVKQYLLELEDEMRAIGKDQSGLVQDLTKRLRLFLLKTASERRVVLEDELANGYVAWVLSNHCELPAPSLYVPHAVAKRLNETQLYRKYRLEGSSKGDVGKLVQKRLRKRPALQASLPKPQPERTQNVGSVSLHQRKPSITPPIAPPLPTALPAIVKMAPSPTGSKRKVFPEQPIHEKMLRSRTANMLLVKVESTIEKQQPVEQERDHDSGKSSPPHAIIMPESAASKRGRSNLLQALSKVKSSQKAKPPAQTNKSTGGRTNRPGGSTGAVAGHRSPSLSSSESSNSRASTPGTSNNNGGGRKQQIEATVNISDDSSNERFLTIQDEPLPSLPCSADELEQYGFLKLFGLYTIEDSNLLKGRKNERKRRSCCSTERKDFHYGRLDYFEQQLYIMQKRRQGANKRLLYIASSAEKANKKRKPWPSGTPPPQPLPPAAVVTKLSRTESLAAASFCKPVNSALREPENKVCFVCNKIGSTDTLSACTECCNIYHLWCHVDEEENNAMEKAELNPRATDDGADDEDENRNHSAVQLLPQRDNFCPICLALASGSKCKK